MQLNYDDLQKLASATGLSRDAVGRVLLGRQAAQSEIAVVASYLSYYIRGQGASLEALLATRRYQQGEPGGYPCITVNGVPGDNGPPVGQRR